MVITYYCAQYFKFQKGDVVIAVNPVSKSSKYKASRFGADIALQTLNHVDFNGIESLEYGDKVPFVVNGPGEYEVKKIFIKGYGVKTSYEEKPFINTIYTFNFDSINVCFLGSLANAKDFTSEIEGKIGSVDILFVPVGVNETLSPAESFAIARRLEPSIIIPIQYEGNKNALKMFIEESGGKAEKSDKLAIKSKDFIEGESKVVILKSSNS